MPEYPLRTFVHAAAETELDASARAEALSWSPNTRRAYVANWKDFTKWCIWNRCAGLPTTPSDGARYLEHLVETEGKTLAIASPRRWRAPRLTACADSLDQALLQVNRGP